MEQSTEQAAQAAASSRQISIAEIRKQQNLWLAVAGGIGTAVVGAIAWALITVVTNMELGIVAVAVGYAVYGYIGAACALFGCVLGNLLSAVAFYAQAQGVPFSQALLNLDGSTAVRLMQVTFSVMDLLFYGIAIYEGYRFSFKYRAN